MPPGQWDSLVASLAANIADGLTPDRLVQGSDRKSLIQFFHENCLDFFIDVHTALIAARRNGPAALHAALVHAFDQRWPGVTQGVLDTMATLAGDAGRALLARGHTEPATHPVRQALFDVFVEALATCHSKAGKSLSDHQIWLNKTQMLGVLRGRHHDEWLVKSPKVGAAMSSNPLAAKGVAQRLDFSAAAGDGKSASTLGSSTFTLRQERELQSMLARVLETRANPRVPADAQQASAIADHVLQGRTVPAACLRQDDPAPLVGAIKKVLGATATRDSLLAPVVAQAVVGVLPDDPVDLSGVDPRSLAGGTLRWLAACLRDGSRDGASYPSADALAIAVAQLFFTAQDYAPPAPPAPTGAHGTPRGSRFLDFWRAGERQATPKAVPAGTGIEHSQATMAKRLEEARLKQAKLINAVRRELDIPSSPWFLAPPQRAGDAASAGTTRSLAKPTGEGEAERADSARG